MSSGEERVISDVSVSEELLFGWLHPYNDVVRVIKSNAARNFFMNLLLFILIFSKYITAYMKSQERYRRLFIINNNFPYILVKKPVEEIYGTRNSD